MGTVIFLSIVIFMFAVSVAWTIFRGAPWVPTPMKIVHKMLKLADLKPNELLYDLGCGDGRIIITAAKHYGTRAVGIELDPIRYLWCLISITIMGLRDQISIIHGDLFKQDLSNADVVICYLLPDTNKKLEDKLLEELQPGTRVVSNTFLFPNIQQTKQDGLARLYMFSPENTIRESIKNQLLSTKK